jgi:hypothetical protein
MFQLLFDQVVTLNLIGERCQWIKVTMSVIDDIAGKIDLVLFFGLGLFDNFLLNAISSAAYTEGTGSDRGWRIV